jgi:hypothetical protein
VVKAKTVGRNPVNSARATERIKRSSLVPSPSQSPSVKSQSSSVRSIVAARNLVNQTPPAMTAVDYGRQRSTRSIKPEAVCQTAIVSHPHQPTLITNPSNQRIPSALPDTNATFIAGPAPAVAATIAALTRVGLIMKAANQGTSAVAGAIMPSPEILSCDIATCQPGPPQNYCLRLISDGNAKGEPEEVRLRLISGGGAKGEPEEVRLRIPGHESNGFIRYPLSLCTADEVKFRFALLGGPWGMNVLTDKERAVAEDNRIAFAFGEVLPSAARQIFDRQHLNAADATRLVDLGAGHARLALQAFLEFPNLQSVVAVEYSQSRFDHAKNMLEALAAANPILLRCDSCQERVQMYLYDRLFELRRQDLWDCVCAFDADIVICETRIPESRRGELTVLLSKLKSGARFLLFHPLCILPNVQIDFDSLRNDLNILYLPRPIPQTVTTVNATHTPPPIPQTVKTGTQSASSAESDPNHAPLPRRRCTRLGSKSDLFPTTWLELGAKFDLWKIT